MQPEKGLSKYQIFQGTVKWLKGLPPRWNEVTSLTDHQWREIKCWFSNLDTEDEEELIERLQDLADASWEPAPPRDETLSEEPQRSGIPPLATQRTLRYGTGNL